MHYSFRHEGHPRPPKDDTYPHQGKLAAPPSGDDPTATARPMRRRTDLYDALLRAQSDLAEGYFVLEGERVVHVSASFCRLCGRDAHDLPTLAAFDGLFDPELRALLAVHAADAFDAGSAEPVCDQHDARLSHASGRLLDVAVTVRLLDIGAGRTQALVLVRDVSDRKRSEAALQEAEARFRAAADASPLPMWVTADDGAPVWFNRPWCEFTGCERRAAAGGAARCTGWDAAVHPEDAARRRADFHAAAAGRVKHVCEYRLRRSDGAWRWVVEEAAPRLLPDGTFAGYVGSCLDITERKEAEAARAAALAENARLLVELRRAANEQRVFLRDILHLVTEGTLRLCDGPEDLPEPLPACGEPGVSDDLTLTASTLSELRRRAQRAANAAGVPDMRGYDLVLAAGEAGMNAVVHAGGGTSRVVADPVSGRVQVWITDEGPGISLSHLHRATLQPGFTTAGTLGQGFSLALKTCDRLYLLTGPTGTTVVLEQGRDAPEPVWSDVPGALLLANH